MSVESPQRRYESEGEGSLIERNEEFPTQANQGGV
jgi:hypothetical protein